MSERSERAGCDPSRWTLVPRIATDEMVEAGGQYMHIVDLWSAMVEAAPQPLSDYRVHIDDALAFADEISEKHRLRANRAEQTIRDALDSLIEPGEGWQEYALRLRRHLSQETEGAA